MEHWKEARVGILERLAEARRLIDARDEGGVMAIIQEQDAFCGEAKNRMSDKPAASETRCQYCEGFIQGGGCLGRLERIDRSILGGDWEEARRLVDEYKSWVESLSLGQ